MQYGVRTLHYYSVKVQSAMANPKDPSERDIQLFRDAVGDVKRLDDDRHSNEKLRPLPIPRQQQLDDAAVIDELLSDPSASEILETGEHLNYRKNGVQTSVVRKLRRGGFTVQDELDLHGLTIEQAREHLRQFLHNAMDNEFRCVQIVHGKGRKTADRAPKLKPFLNHWLQRKREVMAFCSARPEDGGTGAVYVLLSRAR